MKILISILLAIVTRTLADLPPNYRHRSSLGTSPGRHYYSLSLHGPSPQLQYGPPNKITQSSSLILPGGVTIEDLIRLTEKLQRDKYPSGFQSVRHSHTNPQKFLRPPPPQNQILSPANYQTITNVDNFSKNNLPPPKTSYGVPIAPQQNIFQPQNQYGVPENSLGVEPLNRYQNSPLPNQAPIHWNNNNYNNNNDQLVQHLPVKEAGQFKSLSNVKPQQPQQTYNKNANQSLIPNIMPNGFGLITNHPQNHFSAMNSNIQPVQQSNEVTNVNQQLTPVQPNGHQFYPQDNSQNIDPQSPYANSNYAQILVQRNPLSNSEVQPNSFINPQPNQGTNYNNPATTNVQNGRYLPPTTTVRNVFTQVTTQRPAQATEATNDVGREENTNQFTESPLDQPVNNQDPNISIATAVAGADPSLFYLQQPDGRLQKVILQKTQDTSGKPEEYTANYYFQNIETVPNTVYSPLITLG